MGTCKVFALWPILFCLVGLQLTPTYRVVKLPNPDQVSRRGDPVLMVGARSPRINAQPPNSLLLIEFVAAHRVTECLYDTRAIAEAIE